MLFGELSVLFVRMSGFFGVKRVVLFSIDEFLITIDCSYFCSFVTIDCFYSVLFALIPMVITTVVSILLSPFSALLARCCALPASTNAFSCGTATRWNVWARYIGGSGGSEPSALVGAVGARWDAWETSGVY